MPMWQLMAARGGEMRIPIRILAMVTAILASVPQGAFAQQSPVHSFGALQLTRGQLVIVKGEDGETVRGVVTTLADGELDVEWRNWLFKKHRRSFTEQSARLIELHDTTVDGVLKGAAVGALGAFVVYSTCKELACILPFGLSIIVGPTLGGAIDDAVNRTIYTSPGQSVALTVSPLAGPSQFGVAARLRFGSVR
jgi:hypothetical protein